MNGSKVAEKTKKPKFDCENCHKITTQKSNYKTHLKVHNSVCTTLYICAICGRDFNYKNSLHVHMGSHGGFCPFKCNFCGKEFARDSDKTRHERVHTGKSTLTCSQCSKVFRHCSSLEVHQRVAHDVNPKQFNCQFCGLSFKDKSNTRSHEKIVHLCQRPFECSQCEKTFAKKSDFEEHFQSKHDPNFRGYFCSVCPSKFKSKRGLRKHKTRLHLS